jgi:hypothetical protein
LKPFEVRIGLADGSLKNVEGVIETVNIIIDGFTFPIEVVVVEMKGLDRAQMILRRPFLATSRAIMLEQNVFNITTLNFDDNKVLKS